MSKELLFTVTAADCELQTFAAGGPGGQHQNTSNTAVRFIHHPSGARGESREHRSQVQNKRAAWRRMTEHPLFKVWISRQLASGPTPEERVAEDMKPENLRVEVRDGKAWVPLAQ